MTAVKCEKKNKDVIFWFIESTPGTIFSIPDYQLTCKDSIPDITTALRLRSFIVELLTAILYYSDQDKNCRPIRQNGTRQVVELTFQNHPYKVRRLYATPNNTFSSKRCP